MEDAERLTAEADAIGLDNVELALPFAGIGSRTLAAVLDHLVVSALSIATIVVGVVVAAMLSGHDRASVWVAVVFTLLSFGLQWGYWVAVEVMMGGQTPGKRIVGLRSVSRTGGAASAGALTVRNLVRPVDLFVGLPMMAFDRASRRLGDRIAGTVVIHDRPEVDPVMVRRLPAGWGRQRVALVESLIRRETTLEVTVAQDLARRILRLAERDDPTFLEGVTKDLAPTDRVRAAFGMDRL